MWGWMHDGVAVNWWAMAIWMFLFWGGLIALVVWAVRGVSGRTEGGTSAVDIIKHRYARGEITRDEFDDIRRTLSA